MCRVAAPRSGASGLDAERSVTGVQAIAAFCYDFLVGDDWRLAVGVGAGLGLLVLADRVGQGGLWWLLPVAVVVTLVVSLRRATRTS